MNIVTLDDTSSTVVDLGRCGENFATEVLVSIAKYRATFGDGTAVLLYQRASDQAPYPVQFTRTGDTLQWKVSAVDTNKTGYGKLELQWYVGDVLAKSTVYSVRVLTALEAPVEEPDHPGKSWVDQIAEQIENFELPPEKTRIVVQRLIDEGKLRVGLDRDEVIEIVTEHIASAGFVKTVNGVAPDDDGAVNISAEQVGAYSTSQVDDKLLALNQWAVNEFQAIDDALLTKETASNKVSTITTDVTDDTHYPSVEATVDYVDSVVPTAEEKAAWNSKEDGSNKVGAITGDNTDNTHFPSVKAAVDYVDSVVPTAEEKAAWNSKEDSSNKSAAITGDNIDNTHFPSVKAITDWTMDRLPSAEEKAAWNSKATAADIDEAKAEVLDELNVVRESVPTKLNQLTSDVDHRTVTDEQIAEWTNSAGGGGIVVEIGQNQFVYKGKVLPAIAVDTLRALYANDKIGVPQTLHWTLYGTENNLKIVSSDLIAGTYSIDVLVHNEFHCEYSWTDATSGIVNPTVSQQSGNFIDDTHVTTNTTWSSSKIADELASKLSAHTLTVIAQTQDGVTVTGQTVTVRAGTEHGEVYKTAAYNGQPVSFSIPEGFAYHVDITDDLEAHFNPTTAVGIIVDADKSVILQYSDFSNIRTALDVQAALDADVDLTDLVGQKIYSKYDANNLAWEVTNYDAVKSEVSIQTYDTLPTQLPFEPSQALAYFADGLAAGVYCFKHSNVMYYFTLAKPIDAGGQLRATTTQFWTYASQEDTAAIETGTVGTAEIGGATDLGTTATGNLNHMDRVLYGSNNGAESGMLQWLNSDAAANTKLPRLCKFSRPYSVSVAGLLAHLDAEFLSVIEETDWKCATNSVYEAPAEFGVGHQKSTAYTVRAKFFLASRKEVFGTNEGTDAGDTLWQLYEGADNVDRIKRYGGSARNWFLRSATPYYANSERSVSTSGSVDRNSAYSSYGVVPACVIRKKRVV